MGPPYRLAIFDFDGTLADSWQLMGRAMNDAAGLFGYRRLSPGETQALRGQDNRTAMAAMGVKVWQLPRIVMHMRAVALQRADEITLFPGVATRPLLDSRSPTHVVSSVSELTALLVEGWGPLSQGGPSSAGPGEPALPIALPSSGAPGAPSDR